ncbi:hypothetical protein ABPG77_005608 [Micractinium sp. CCAP 211/92]
MASLTPHSRLQAAAAPCRMHASQSRSYGLRKRACHTAAYSTSAAASAAAASGPAASNLGVLAPLAAPDPQQAALFVQQQQQAAPADFSGGGIINVDGPAIAASLLVLLMLLALSFNRILGLERLLGKWLLALQERRQYERRNQVIEARLNLEQQFASPLEEGEEGGDSDGSRGGPRPGSGGAPGSGRT